MKSFKLAATEKTGQGGSKLSVENPSPHITDVTQEIARAWSGRIVASEAACRGRHRNDRFFACLFNAFETAWQVRIWRIKPGKKIYGKNCWPWAGFLTGKVAAC